VSQNQQLRTRAYFILVQGKKLDETLRECGVAPTASEPCLFQIGSGEDATLTVNYVAGSDQKKNCRNW
jgi:hypothetical protein